MHFLKKNYLRKQKLWHLICIKTLVSKSCPELCLYTDGRVYFISIRARQLPSRLADLPPARHKDRRPLFRQQAADACR